MEKAKIGVDISHYGENTGDKPTILWVTVTSIEGLKQQCFLIEAYECLRVLCWIGQQLNEHQRQLKITVIDADSASQSRLLSRKKSS